MTLKKLKPGKALNKAFLKVKPNRTEIEGFKTNLIALLDRTNDTESEEFHKNLVSDFLKDTYYKQNHFINTKGRNDLVIHNGQNANSTVGVILEAKKPTNKSEMIKSFAEGDSPKQMISKLNVKAFQELVLYYLRERITHKNFEVKHLVATNINEWFIFDATLFDRLFAQNKNLVKQFNDFEVGRLADTKTDFFYKQIAEPFIDSITSEIEFTYFNIQDFQKPLRNTDKADDNSLIALFKLLSPEHLLKLPFTNDSNSLDKRFYSELLHIIGLNETKEGSKKLIERNKSGERHSGTILEDAIIQLDSLDKLSRLEKPSQFGNTKEERLFNVALELSITWINRILFLKLLEAQLITYHKTPLLRGAGGVSEYKFLNLDKIKNYDDLNSLFFQVLARRYDERNEDVKKIFEKVPYLNSSLFEPTDIEQVTLFISNLKDDKTIPIFSQTVLKDQQGRKRTGNIKTLQYLFEFLDAYDFGAEGGGDIQEDNKTLINASVLGLIFEKINGYKDGSFFTPGFITMYMCRETIRKAVVQKFNEAAQKSPLERGFRGVSNPLLRGAGGVNPPLSREASGANPPLLRGAGGVSIRREIIPYNPKLKELARQLRNNSTKSEIILWKELKGKFEGKYDFHRQKPLDNYIADFFCYELKLVIEIDGETHNWEETQQKDFEKESRLNELGLNVLRFPDSDIFKHLDATLETIKQYIIGFEKGDLSLLKYEETPLNPLTENVIENVTPLNPLKRGDFKTLDDVYEQIGDDRMFTRQEANNIVNSIKICDPAVGSGHFLVSALNEMIAVKNDLKILQDRDGKRLKEYQVEVVNDELIVTDEEGELFEYNPGSAGSPANSESQRIQETLFHEKQTIIENCLFGVDINSNSVKICRLRLWIELLKNAYYKQPPNTPLSRGAWGVPPLSRGAWGVPPLSRGVGGVDTPLSRGVGGVDTPLSRGVGGVLETLPNIDINIKCGNSLVSRFAIDADLSQALKKSKGKWSIDMYRIAVDTYRNAESKEQKREMERLIADIKSDFRSEISLNDPKVKKLRKLSGDLFQMTNQGQLFEMSKKEKADWNKKVQQLTQETKKLETEIEEIRANKIFENAFEWRFEFPEVLNDGGDFVGFDVVIGNPPYGVKLDNSTINILKSNYPAGNSGILQDSYISFIVLGLCLGKPYSILSYIIPNTWRLINIAYDFRKDSLNKFGLYKIDTFLNPVFDEAVVDCDIVFYDKNENKKISLNINDADKQLKSNQISVTTLISQNIINSHLTENQYNLIQKLQSETEQLKNIMSIKNGVKPYEVGKGNPKQTKVTLSEKPFTKSTKIDDTFVPLIGGSDFHRYTLKWNKDNYISYGPWLAAPRDAEIFEKDEKIIVRQTSDKLIATIIQKGFVMRNNTHILLSYKADHKLKFILALLNSKLFDFIYWTINPEKGEALAEVKAMHLDQLPIKLADNSTQEKIEALVEQILTKKLQDHSADTTDLENEIDSLVYRLYELTEEEIKIIESA